MIKNDAGVMYSHSKKKNLLQSTCDNLVWSVQEGRGVTRGMGGQALSNITFFGRPDDDVWRLERETMNEVNAGRDCATSA
jgi:hypothetical protein